LTSTIVIYSFYIARTYQTKKKERKKEYRAIESEESWFINQEALLIVHFPGRRLMPRPNSLPHSQKVMKQT
jgi:hypothetical protein